MDSSADLKQGLHKMIEQIKDINILTAVYVILEREKQREENDEDFYDQLHPLLKQSIERGLNQVKEGKTIPHDEIKKRYEK